MDEALDLHRRGLYEQACERYAAVLREQPEHAQALHLLGLIHFQNDDPETAHAYLARSLDLCPDNVAALTNQASVCMALQRNESAISLLRKALELAPGHAPAWRNLGDALAGVAQLQEAAQAYAQAVDCWPEDLDKGSLPLNLAVTLSGLGRYEEAAGAFRDIIRTQPHNAVAHCNLGLALRKLDAYDDGCRAFEEALALEPDMYQAHLGLAHCLEKIGELDKAEVHARRARDLSPCEETWFRLGHVLQEQGELERARHCYVKTLACNPRCVVALNNMGVLYMNEGQLDDAAEWFDNARDCDPTYAEAWTNWANILEKRGELEKAENAARMALRLQESSNALVRLGYILQRMGRLEEALEVYRRYHERDPNDTKGVMLYLAGIGLQEMPDRAPDAHIRDLFDYYAGFFEKHLREKLEYRGPEVLLSVLGPWLQERLGEGPPAPELDIMDLGCGTGLCGAVFSPFARRLDGVDLSPRMLAKARARAIYHELIEADLDTALANVHRSYDVMVAGDVFVYLGKLQPVFKGVRRLLRPNGVFAFTLETHDGPGVIVGEASRYRHGKDHLYELARQYDFETMHMEEVTLRYEADKPVQSLVVALRKPV